MLDAYTIVFYTNQNFMPQMKEANETNIQKESQSDELYGKDDFKEISKFLFEVGTLKNVRRSGWWHIGIKQPETVAEHSFRAVLLAYILAKMEGLNPSRAMLIALLHDVPEARVTDVNKLAGRYIDAQSAEQKAGAEQISNLPEPFASEFSEVLNEMFECITKEAIVAKDADLLECAFQAIEYRHIGHESDMWIINSEARLKTNSAKLLLAQAKEMNPNSWWHNIRKKFSNKE